MNLAKTLKKKRDAEERLRKRSPSPTFLSGGGPSGGDIFVTEQTIVNQINNLSFTTLPDTPSSYTGQAGKVVAVNETEDGLVFIDAPSGGGFLPLYSGTTFLFSPDGKLLGGLA